MVSKKVTLLLIACVALLTTVTLSCIKPIQLPNYHNFADQRSWLGVPHAWNVLSNVVFAFAGIWGLFLLLSAKQVQFYDSRERWFWLGVSLGLFLTALGSTYYHLAPDNFRLVWDRLPMSLVFMSFMAALIGERINIYLGLWLWPVLIGMGLCSVLLWRASALQGNEDLRFYMGIQIVTILVALVMLISKSPYNRNWDLAIIILCYGLAMLFDVSDPQIYKITGNVISGHTLKHLMAGLAGVWLIRMVAKRKIVSCSLKKDQR